MGTSDCEQISNVMDLITRMQPTSVLDIGVGFGKMGLLCREYLDLWWGRYMPDEWKTRIDGIEVFPNNRNPIHDYCYNEIIYANVMDHLDSVGNYQLVLMIDVIEHLSKDDGARLLGAIRNFYIVTTPRTFACEGRVIRGNTYESHISRWYPSEFPKSLILERQFIAWRDTVKNVPDKVSASLDATEMREEQKVHFCSTGPEFPYMYYIGVMTALKAYGHNRVTLWITEEPKSEYFELLKDKVTIKRVAVENVQDFPALRDKDDHFRHVAIFDYSIWNIVHKFGGMIMGLDSITLKPHFDLLDADKELLAGIDERDVLHFSMHGVIVRKGSAIAQAVLTDAISCMNGRTMIWGESGIVPFICHTKLNIEKVSIVPYGVVGRRPSGLFSDDGQLIDPDTRTIALYASSGIVELNEQYVTTSNSLYARLVKQILTPEEWAPGIQDLPKQKESLAKVKEHKRFHLLGLPHVPTNKIDGLACAYSQKVLKMGHMLKSMGHTVFFYGVEGSTVECDEFIQVSTRDVLRQAYGDYDWKKECFKHAAGDIAYTTFNRNAIREIGKRKIGTDFLLSPWPGNKPVHDALATGDVADNNKLYLSVEMGIGYAATFTQFRVFESYNWMSHVCGIQTGLAKRDDTNGGTYDVAIPNYFDPEDFQYCEDKDDYFMYLGRIIMRKGVIIAGETCEAIGAKLLMAGQDGGEKMATEGPTVLEYMQSSPNVEYVGFADHDKRKELLAKAKALFVPTQYWGPFEGVTIEAALSGTPVITTDFGVFPETVIHGVTGYRCRTKDHFVWAARNIDKIKPADCYKWAMDNFTMERVARQYEEYWNMLLDIKCGNAWKTENPERQELNWLNRVYPG